MRKDNWKILTSGLVIFLFASSLAGVASATGQHSDPYPVRGDERSKRPCGPKSSSTLMRTESTDKGCFRERTELPDFPRSLKLDILFALGSSENGSGGNLDLGEAPALSCTINEHWKVFQGTGASTQFFRDQECRTGLVQIEDQKTACNFFRPEAASVVVFIPDLVDFSGALSRRDQLSVLDLHLMHCLKKAGKHPASHSRQAEELREVLSRVNGSTPYISGTAECIHGPASNDQMRISFLADASAAQLLSSSFERAVERVLDCKLQKIQFQTILPLGDRQNIDPKSIRLLIDSELVPFQFDSEKNEVRTFSMERPGARVEIDFCTAPPPTPSPTPSPSTTPTPSPSPIPSPTTTPTPTPDPSPSTSPTPDPSPSSSPSPSPSPTDSPAPSPSPSPTATPDPSPTATASPSPTPSPTTTPDPSPTVTASPSPTPSPAPSPTPSPDPSPSPSPSNSPTCSGVECGAFGV